LPEADGKELPASQRKQKLDIDGVTTRISADE
jgi:hypothetical protein